MRNNTARPISDIFVLTGDIGGWGRGKERKGWGERPQGPVGGGVGGPWGGGQNEDSWESLRSKTETGRRTTTRALTTVEERRRQRGHDGHVRSDRDRGERRGARKGDREAESKG